jgi:predicted nucleic acid-binding protein
MGSSLTCLTDPAALLVADASTVININATGCARNILEALPNRVAIVDIVPGELEAGRHRSRQDADLLKDLVVSGLVEIVELDDMAEQYFEQLVIGPAKSTLDDGEAATIAHAVSRNEIALIDERKATRLCAQRFPGLRLACTVDIFTHPKVRDALGNDSLAEAVFNALSRGRMRVFAHHVEWVVGLIGTDRARLCTSLPGRVRGSQQVSAGQAIGVGSKRILR